MADKAGLALAVFEALKGSGGGSGVTDVQVNGTSVVTDGVANVPVAGRDIFGAVKVETGYYAGVLVNINGALQLQVGDGGFYKAGVQMYVPVTCTTQQLATFYGLAKAAGADMKDIASTTVGIYPAAQKSAIQAMLGILDMIAPAEGAQASKAYSIGKAFCHAGALYKATSAIASGDAIVPGTNCEQTTIIDLIGG